jgi:hypothetical protein
MHSFFLKLTIAWFVNKISQDFIKLICCKIGQHHTHITISHSICTKMGSNLYLTAAGSACPSLPANRLLLACYLQPPRLQPAMAPPACNQPRPARLLPDTARALLPATAPRAREGEGGPHHLRGRGRGRC